MNKVIVIGNLGRDPEVRQTSGGTSVCHFSIATTERFTDKSGERQEKTEWHQITAWARLAEIAGEYLRKGSKVAVEGKLATRQWEDKDGNTRYTTEIIVAFLEMLGDGRGNSARQASPSRSKRARKPAQEDLSAYYPGDSPGDDDIPF